MAESALTGKNEPTHKIMCTSDVDYITVVGARTDTEFFLRSPGNEYRFINQGLRQVKLFPKTTSDLLIQNILVVFQHGYTATDIKIINEYTNDLGARIVYVKSIKEFILFLNQRIEKKRSVKSLVFFSHGLVGFISLRYEGTDENAGVFDKNSVNQVNKLIFDYDAEIVSYACRTGIGVDASSFNNSAEGKPELSLAQYIADTWMVTVKAYEKRSSYAKTYGTGSEIKEAEQAKTEIENYDNALKQYTAGKALQKPNKPVNYDQNKERLNSIAERTKNSDKTSSGPIMPLGAWHPPTSGDTPKGLKDGLQTYKPSKK
ncbi:hypothetical protein RFI36_16680 [Acinetobacter gerneri]|uniref:DUF4347 domain-containing protein n=1 Tax=Acinetobacter gerneri TaxID=202952 RepID=A0AAW8JMF8_9GAMM|nr:hypothetical protein [Acinetobacter gerneri]MDQ9011336.1 hypothetical protein [Acinetobacter gerneri]MDQ9015472.1 hypothetical protein [Acinetobacter gerneri]MDQ9026624.1 hypothetical protein [Acinetobacter gerneri]MDQ9053924.1 hypothetical protein [Acinetobacter gerneri]MDQ9061575.1 hypothetical protein [Acinetobacter gerneri]